MEFAEGLLSGREARRIERHVARCASCRNDVDALRSVADMLRRGARAPAARRPGCPGAEELAAFADGSLGGARRATVESHIARCGACLKEVADLWSLMESPPRAAPGRAVLRVLERLERDGRRAVVEFGRRSVRVLEDFGHRSRAVGVYDPGAGIAPAVARGSAGRELRWSGAGDIEVACRLVAEGERLSVVGEVTRGGRPEVAVSVALRTRRAARGFESVDPRGRFGPWPLEEGENTIVLSASGLPERGLELVLEVVPAAPGAAQ